MDRKVVGKTLHPCLSGMGFNFYRGIRTMVFFYLKLLKISISKQKNAVGNESATAFLYLKLIFKVLRSIGHSLWGKGVGYIQH